VTMPLADVRFETVGRVVVARFEGEIDLSNADALHAAVARQISNHALGLVLDLAGVGYLDSAGIHVIYELREHLRARGQAVRVVVPSDSPVAEALRLADVPRSVGVAETVEAALRSLDD
jgi:anti-sigma B factor antagonist